jgi:hypothetical protein
LGSEKAGALPWVRRHRGAGAPVPAGLSCVGRYDPRLERKQVRIGRVDLRAHPMRVSRAKGLDAREVREHSARRAIERLVDLEIVTVAVDERHLAREGDRFRLQGIGVIRQRVPRPGVGQVLLVVEIEIGRRKELPFEVEAFQRIRVRQRGRSIAAPAIGPVVVARQPDQRPIDESVSKGYRPRVS